MQIKKLVLGELATNCYLIIKDNKCLIIDPADGASKIIEATKNYQVESILVTHHHFDHIGALKTLEDYYHLKHNNHQNSFDYEVIATPGHTKDCLTFYFKNEKIMFTGDFLFYHSYGRVDLGGNAYDMANSLNLIKKYPDDIIIYPGHGPISSLREEKKQNWFLNF